MMICNMLVSQSEVLELIIDECASLRNGGLARDVKLRALLQQAAAVQSFLGAMFSGDVVYMSYIYLYIYIYI